LASAQHYLYISDDQATLTTLDASGVIQLRQHGELALPDTLSQLAAGEQHLCATTSRQELLYIALDNGKPAQILSQTTMADEASGVAVIEGGCVTLDAAKGMRHYRLNENNELAYSDRYQSNRHSFQISSQSAPLAVADGRTGLTLLGHDHQQQLQWIGSYNKLGSITLVDKQDSRVLVADERGILSLFDVSRPETPLLLSDFRLPAKADAIALDDGIAYARSGDQLLQIDFSAESTPAISNLGVNLGGSRRSFIEDDVLYVADWFSGMHIYDISKPHSPRLISSFKTPGSPKGVLVRDGIAYVADDDKGMQFVDVSDLRQPKLISHLPLDGLAYTMKLRGDWLYLAAHYGGFHILNVADIKNPRLVGTVNTPAKAWAVALQGDLAYVADDETGVLIFDVSNPAKPKLSGQYDPKGFAEDIVIRDGIAYVAFFDQGLHILDLRQNPNKPKLISQLPTPGNARGIQLDGDRLYLASWEAGVHVLDISDLSQPDIIGQYDTAGATWGLSQQGNMVYAMDWWGGVRIIDVSDENRPSEISQYQGAGIIQRLALKDKFAYAASGSRGLQVFDASNALNPVWATGVDLEGVANDVATTSSHAFVAAGDGGLVVVDISNPFQSRWLARLPLDGAADRILISGHYALVTEDAGALHIVDIDQAAQPQLINTLNLGVKDMWLNNNDLFVISDNGNTLVVDAKNMTDLNIKQRIASPQAHLVRAWEDQLYLVEAGKGIRTLRLHNGQYQASNAQLNHQGDIQDLQQREQTLYASVKDLGLLRIQTSDDKLQLETVYRSTHRITQIALNQEAIFMAGENIITSAKLLPKINKKHENNNLTLSIPPTLPIGSYHLLLQQRNGEQQVIHNAFKVSFPKKVKPKFTLEDLKKIMQKKQFEGKAPN
jgi:hypothetical protein